LERRHSRDTRLCKQLDAVFVLPVETLLQEVGVLQERVPFVPECRAQPMSVDLDRERSQPTVCIVDRTVDQSRSGIHRLGCGRPKLVEQWDACTQHDSQ
jgi:hypothetical protein